MKASRFLPLRTASPDAVGQCKRCGATMSIDMVDVISGLNLIHKDPMDPRYVSNPCGGTVKLYQEVRYES